MTERNCTASILMYDFFCVINNGFDRKVACSYISEGVKKFGI